jgi:MFS family permease
MGTFIAPLIGSLVVATLGWRTTMIVFSIPGMLVGVAFLLVAETKRSSKLSVRSNLAVLQDGVRHVFKNRTVLAVMIVEMIMAFRIGARDFIPSYLSRDLGIASFETGLLFAVFLGSGIPAPYIWGYLSDRFEKRKVVMLTMSIACVLWWLLPYGGDSFGLLFILLPLGFVGQGVGGIIQAFLSQTVALESRDLTYGVYFTLAFTIGSFSPVILGYLADYFSFQAAFSYVAIVSLLAVVAAYFLR